MRPCSNGMTSLLVLSNFMLIILTKSVIAFKITGVTPQVDSVTVWTETTGREEKVRLNYTVVHLLPTNPSKPPISGYYSDLRSSFLIVGLKPDAWYGLHLSIAYSSKGQQFIDPAHDIAFKTLPEHNDSDVQASENASTAVSPKPISIAARPVAGGFQLRIADTLEDSLQETPTSAHVTAVCAIDQNIGVAYQLAGDHALRQTKDFMLNASRLPESLIHQDPATWAMDACSSICWSVFISAANASFVLDTECANLTDVFTRSGSDMSLWEEKGNPQHADSQDGHNHKGLDEHSRPGNETSHNRSSPLRSGLENYAYCGFVMIVTVIYVLMTVG